MKHLASHQSTAFPDTLSPLSTSLTLGEMQPSEQWPDSPLRSPTQSFGRDGSVFTVVDRWTALFIMLQF
jgi:hypothetical protein